MELHAAIADLEYRDNELLWGGRTVTSIAEEIGSTPFYAYDRARMAQRVNELRHALPAGLTLHYAMKANPMPAVVEEMLALVDGLDIASEGELRTALACGADPQNISFAGPGKRDAELRYAIETGITINLESESEMRRLARIAESFGGKPNVAVRINPPFELKTSGMKMGGLPSPFGVDAERVPRMLEELASTQLQFRGFHIFSGAQNLRADTIVESMRKTVELVVELAHRTGVLVYSVNLGGGLGIPYFPKEHALQLTEVCDATHHAVADLRRELGEVEVILELGRYLVGEAGIYVTRVLDIKESRGTRFAICDGGMHHHLAASGNFGQVIRKNYPVVAVERSKETDEVTIVGPLCTPLDMLADRITTSVLREGSLVAVLQSGAYGRSASPERFLSHPPCAEILL